MARMHMQDLSYAPAETHAQEHTDEMQIMRIENLFTQEIKYLVCFGSNSNRVEPKGSHK